MVTNNLEQDTLTQLLRDICTDFLSLVGYKVTPIKVEAVAVKPKTNVELAEEILTKNNYCPTHLVKRQRDSRNLGYCGRFEDICPDCEKEVDARYKLAQEKLNAARDLEIEFALDVMRGRTVCSKDTNHE